ncbi:PDZ domain-containing protein [Clostridium cavendishii DSM 21758]|uniref:PDZ domain-containing protein n=1 Tax=Clostridium cavendishii DSM 21758 TaxID=1121302 RepID=A0A1M6TV89_9CLOT|nr:PDZ domain-containing protein [Clostridium cavendishii]SHK60814.1 PDZ domain-containing protein [Clostridium cavendishii DSM 21758]
MELALYTLRAVAYAIIEPSMALVMLAIGIMFYMQNKKVAAMQRMIIGERLCSPLELTLSQMVLGIFAGTLASLMLTSLGVVFNENSGIEILFIISVLLMLYKPRFFCFSYSAAILGMISIISSIICSNIGQPSPIKVNITSLITFVGILHVVEGLLVMLDGTKGAVPVFTNRDDKIMGGFALKRNWALPIAIIIAGSGYGKVGFDSLPILNSKELILALATAAMTIIPYYGVVGYNTVTFTRTKREKSLQVGFTILVYGAIITLVAQTCRLGLPFEIFAVLITPIAHEGVMILQRNLEAKRKPKFVSDENGVVVLEVSPNSQAYIEGIKSGDRILEINDNKVNSELEVYTAIKQSYMGTSMKIKNSKGEIVDKLFNFDKTKRIGVVLVPLMVKQDDVIDFNAEKFKDVLDKIRKKDEH